ncbi:MAG: hypothetical protein LQ340_008058, partial [Diploschistes diacapsis]
TAVLLARRPSSWLDGLRNPACPAFASGAAASQPTLAPLQPTPPLATSDADAEPPMPAQGRAGYRAAHAQLLALQGVGPKVADCVCLMGLGWGEAVPVDTHVWAIAQRDYRMGKNNKGARGGGGGGGGRGRATTTTLTKALYDAVGDHFRALWGAEAGWAHSVLFAADLRAFKADAASTRGKKAAEVATETHGLDGERRATGPETQFVRVKLEDAAAEAPPSTPLGTTPTGGVGSGRKGKRKMKSEADADADADAHEGGRGAKKRAKATTKVERQEEEKEPPRLGQRRSLRQSLRRRSRSRSRSRSGSGSAWGGVGQ